MIKRWSRVETLMENYLLRIYRIEKDNPRNLVGLVEKIGDKKRMGFASLDELWQFLNASAAKNSQPKSSIEENEFHFAPGRAKKGREVREKKVQKR
jgi:hypothetical protein